MGSSKRKQHDIGLQEKSLYAILCSRRLGELMREDYNETAARKSEEMSTQQVTQKDKMRKFVIV